MNAAGWLAGRLAGWLAGWLAWCMHRDPVAGTKEGGKGSAKGQHYVILSLF
jgi:hypothetical protein